MNLPVRKTKCATCPFRPESPYANLASDLAKSAIEEASRICHSTGSNGLMGRTGLPSFVCRGARDVQLEVMTALGVITAPTDQALNEARELIGMDQQEVRDPVPSRTAHANGKKERRTLKRQAKARAARQAITV